MMKRGIPVSIYEKTRCREGNAVSTQLWTMEYYVGTISLKEPLQRLQLIRDNPSPALILQSSSPDVSSSTFSQGNDY